MSAARARPLPLPLSTFIGRADELAALRDLAGRARLVSLVGPGGCGKTRLALEHLVAGAPRRRVDGAIEGPDAAGPRHGDGPEPATVAVVELAAVLDGERVTAVLAEAFGVRADATSDPLEHLVDQLGDDEVCALIDNCEHLVDEVARVVGVLLTRCRGASFVITSREPLGVAGEVIYRVPSLGLPPAGSTFAAAATSDAVRLFVERAALVRPELELDDAAADAVVEICRRVDGLPLAIELAAARLTVLSPARIAAGLDDRFRLLTGGGRAALSRHRTLHACVAWSYGLLTADEQRLLDLLSVFSEGCRQDAVEAVAAGELDADLVFDLLDRLVHKSLVIADPRSDGTRFTLLETIAAFAADRLADDGGAEPARDRHLAHYAAFVADAEPELTGADQDRWLRSLRAEQGNIRAALSRAAERAERGDPAAAATVWAMVGGLTFFWSTAGRFHEARAWFERCAAHPTVPAQAELPARWGAAHVALYGGDFGAGLSLAADAYERAVELGDTRYAGRALNSLGTTELFIDVGAAFAKQDHAVELAEAAGDDWCLADALQAAAYGYALVLAFEEATKRLARARPIAERLDHPLLLAWDRIGVALVAAQAGDVRAGLAALPAAAVQVERTGDPNLAMNLLAVEAMTAFLAGHGHRWLDRLDEARVEAPRRGAGEAVPMIALWSAILLVGHGETARARAVMDEHLPLIEAFTPAMASRALAVDALAALQAGDLGRAREQVDAARPSTPPPITARAAAAHELAAALVAWGEGDLGRAEAAVLEALPTIAESGARTATVDALEILAVVLVAKEDRGGAARALGTAAGLRHAMGIVRTELDAFTRPALVATREQAVIDPDLAAAWREGEVASLDDVVAHARRTRGARRRPSLGWDSLTPTEVRVASLVAEGSTNAQVALQLFVANETVKTHLSHIYTKLDLPNRAALSAAYTRWASTGDS